MSLQAFHTALDDGASQHTISLESIQDPKCSKRKGAPRKFRKKSPLESNSSKAKSRPNSVKGRRSEVGPSKLGKVQLLVQTCDQGSYYMQAPVTFSELMLDGADDNVFAQQEMSPSFFPVAPPSDLLYSQDPQKSHSNRTVIVKSTESTSGSTSTGILMMHFIVSLGIILAMDKYLKKAFIAAAIKFPSTLFGIFYVFATLNVLDFVVLAAASGLMNFFEPAFLFIQR
ncbi:uncharacterized protein LOC111401257 isoform X2 [Olea europaea var. sylvestris]|uniref:Plastidal glycolate glycerate translocator 1, chloroplastic n=1 Tax=Olea europaea subsp. europaea TaxID=158383 RepID=A0A8S0PY44_OLEEU|nr:uncharacterized protein LOC111401257 isoform X2 [Olea europaea var. sylvestris]CAA2959597.1 plastidal glycolate glycerate translocator 1, chloroplastic [Olea europaea subsp. europaea]